MKVHTLLARQGVDRPDPDHLERFCAELCGPRRGQGTTVRVADGEPGDELQVDFGRMGLLFDSETGRRRVCHAAAIFTLLCPAATASCGCASPRPWPTSSEGFEAAWAFYGGVVSLVIPDNMSPIVDKANPTEPRLNQAFVEYAQDRGFLIDATRVRHPKDKPRVERAASLRAPVRSSPASTSSTGPTPSAGPSAGVRPTAGLRVHGTTACRPAEHFAAVEARLCSPVPSGVYDLPHYATPKVHRDHHIEVAKALYSVPGDLIGRHVDAEPIASW